MSEHDHQFPEEKTPQGVLILLPCLLCGLAAGDAMAHASTENERLRAELCADEQMLSQLLAALNQATELGATRVHVGDLRVAVLHRLQPLRKALTEEPTEP
jgi:hypothetical protein